MYAQQWGLWSQNNTYANVLFSMAYPQQCLNVTASDYNDTSNDTEGIGEALLLSDITINGFRVSKQNVSIKTIWISLGKQQWGLTPALQSSNITFPVETSNSLFVELTPQDSVNGVAVLFELNNKGFNFAINAFNATGYPSVAWLLFGIAQQWGEYVDGYNTFSIEFTAFCVVAAGGEYMYDDLGSTILEIKLHQFTALANLSGTKKTFIAAGKQQWGFNYEVKSTNPFDLPIAYNEAIFCVVASAADWSATGTWWFKNGATLDKIAIGVGSDDTPASGNFTYLAIGVQQWGYEQNNEIVTLLLPYTTAYIPVGCAALLDAEFSLTIQDNSNFFRPVRSTAYWFTIGS